jgi:hypothetical protein
MLEFLVLVIIVGLKENGINLFYVPRAFVNNTAITKPAKSATPFPNDSLLNASRIIVSPDITIIAPAGTL